jgi:holo-[acyl-carrier protein] synthase
MAILGVGTDIIEIDRIADVFNRQKRFAEKIFTPGELSYCMSKKNWPQHAAGRWAAKEAVGKAIGCPLSWQDVEIANGDLGKPEVRLHGKAKELVGSGRIMLSVSHSQNYATAVAVLVSDDT